MSESTRRPPRIQTVGVVALALAVVLSVVAIVTVVRVFDTTSAAEQNHERYEACTQAATNLMEASDYLTTQARMYVVTGERAYLDGYLNELHVTRRRNKAVQTLSEQFKGHRAYLKLSEALDASNALAENELYGMRLTAEVYGLSPLPESMQRVVISAEDEALPTEQKDARAKDIMFGASYQSLKDRIVKSVNECTSELISSLNSREVANVAQLNQLLNLLRTIVVAFVGLLGAVTLANYLLIVRPIRAHTASLEQNEPLDAIGAYELRGVAESYNSMYEENHRRTMLLKHEAETDALTGLLNRGSYDKLLEHHGEDIALILMDIDLFKDVNDTYGHGTGDEVLRKVAASVAEHFRTTDYACRIGGDEFAVIMTEMHNVSHNVVVGKLQGIADDLHDTSDGLPATTLSVGIAMSDNLPEGADIYHAADEALYESKRRGRNRHTFYGDKLDEYVEQLQLW